MSLPEVCSVWIEQRVDEEKDSGKSGREIGRIIAAEVEKYFEVTVSPEAIRGRVKRMGQTDPPPENPTESTTNHNLEKLEKTQHGGQRDGSGRKPRKRNKPAVGDERITDNFQEAYDRMVWAIKEERDDGWSKMTKETALRRADSLVQILTYGK